MNTPLHLVQVIVLNDGSRIDAVHVVGMNHVQGNPYDYGVRTLQGTCIIVPRGQVQHFILPVDYELPGEKAA